MTITTGQTELSRFIAQASRPAGLADVDVETADPVELDLLVSDATTEALAAAAGCEVTVAMIEQKRAEPPSEVAAWLAFGDDRTATPLRRRARLGAADDGRAFAWAESYIQTERLPPEFMALAGAGRRGLREAIAAAGLDPSRELLWYGRAQTPAWTAVDDPALSRAYRILNGSAPAIVIIEYFAPAAIVSAAGAHR